MSAGKRNAKARLLCAAALAMAMAACSSEDSRARRAYMLSCNLALRNEGVCICTYDRLRAKHSAEELFQASTSGEMPSPELMRDMAEASIACIKQAQTGP